MTDLAPSIGSNARRRKPNKNPAWNKGLYQIAVDEAVFADHFWAKVNKTETCWLWTGASLPRGYGKLAVRIEGKQRHLYAHRVAYEILIGAIPNGYEIDHLCRVTACVRPEHLEPVTSLENQRRTQQLFCKRGHERAGDNLYISPNNERHCRSCRTIHEANRPKRAR